MKDSVFIENDPMFVSARMQAQIIGNQAVITAQYPSICKDCGKKIEPGDDIIPQNNGWVHWSCE
jgi:hypothetical protein